MTNKPREIFKAIIQKYLAFISLMRSYYYRKQYSKVEKKIEGNNNVLNYNGSILSSVVFDIIGNNNIINIGKSCSLDSVAFYIRGNDLSISIGEGCRFNKGGNIRFEDSFSMLEIGDCSTFENVDIAVTGPGSVTKADRDGIGNNSIIRMGKSCFLDSVAFYIRGNNHSISIGEGCRFNRGGSIWFEDSFGKLEIGDSSSFENVHIAVTEPGSVTKIGRDCMFAYDIDIRTGDSHSIIDTKKNERINFAQDVSIGDHVWIAAHCIILKGTHISDESVLASGSVVTKKFSQKGVIIAGNPARVVKEGISWLRDRIYMPH